MASDLSPALKSTTAKAYLIGRGLSTDEIRKWGILWDRYRKAVVLPVLDFWGGVVFLTLRRLEGEGPKWVHLNPDLSSTGVPARNWLYGCHQEPSAPAVLVEGPFDAISVARLGYVGLAVLGSALTTVKGALLTRFAQEGKVYCWPDSDNPTSPETWGRVARKFDIQVVAPPAPYSPLHPEGKLDPDWLVREDREWIEFGLHQMTRG